MDIESLSPSERILLAEALWDSVVPNDGMNSIPQTQLQELKARLHKYELGDEAGSDWKSVKKRVSSGR